MLQPRLLHLLLVGALLSVLGAFALARPVGPGELAQNLPDQTSAIFGAALGHERPSHVDEGLHQSLGSDKERAAVATPPHVPESQGQPSSSEGLTQEHKRALELLEKHKRTLDSGRDFIRRKKLVKSLKAVGFEAAPETMLIHAKKQNPPAEGSLTSSSRKRRYDPAKRRLWHQRFKLRQKLKIEHAKAQLPPELVATFNRRRRGQDRHSREAVKEHGAFKDVPKDVLDSAIRLDGRSKLKKQKGLSADRSHSGSSFSRLAPAGEPQDQHSAAAIFESSHLPVGLSSTPPSRMAASSGSRQMSQRAEESVEVHPSSSLPDAHLLASTQESPAARPIRPIATRAQGPLQLPVFRHVAPSPSTSLTGKGKAALPFDLNVPASPPPPSP